MWERTERKTIPKPPQFNVIVECGEDFDDFQYLQDSLDSMLRLRAETGHRICILCWYRGFNRACLARDYAVLRGYDFSPHRPEWKLEGRNAYYNGWDVMLRTANAIVVFWDGKNRNAERVIDMAYKRHIPVRVRQYDAEETKETRKNA